MTDELLVVARLGRPHGLRGEVFARLYNPAPDRWRPGRELLLIDAEQIPGDPERIAAPAGVGKTTLRSIRKGAKGRWVLGLDGLSSREDAEAMNGAALAMRVIDLEPPGPGEFYFHEVAGWAVETVDGEAVGAVVRAFSTTVDLFEVRPRGGGETFYVPVVDDIVKSVDREQGRVVIDPIEGLLP